MKSGYNTISNEEESKSLTNSGIPETGASRITKKKQQFLFALVFTIFGFMMGHLTNTTTTHHSGVRMSKESMAALLEDPTTEGGVDLSPCLGLCILEFAGECTWESFRNGNEACTTAGQKWLACAGGCQDH